MNSMQIDNIWWWVLQIIIFVLALYFNYTIKYPKGSAKDVLGNFAGCLNIIPLILTIYFFGWINLLIILIEWFLLFIITGIAFKPIKGSNPELASKDLSSSKEHISNNEQSNEESTSVISRLNDINELIDYLVLRILNIYLKSNTIWKCYGYPKRPQHGQLAEKLFPAKYELENYISKQILIISITDVLNGIKKSAKSFETKIIVSVGVIDRIMPLIESEFQSDVLIENIFSTYEKYKKDDKSKPADVLMSPAKEALSRKDLIKFIFGTVQLFGDKNIYDLFLNSDQIKDDFNNYKTDDTFGLSLTMPATKLKYYRDLLTKTFYKNSEDGESIHKTITLSFSGQNVEISKEESPRMYQWALEAPQTLINTVNSMVEKGYHGNLKAAGMCLANLEDDLEHQRLAQEADLIAQRED